jgi:hypothetical protein
VDRFRITDTGVSAAASNALPYRVMPHGYQPKPDADYSVEVWGHSGARYTIAPAGLDDAYKRGLRIEGPWDSIRVYNSPERAL